MIPQLGNASARFRPCSHSVGVIGLQAMLPAVLSAMLLAGGAATVSASPYTWQHTYLGDAVGDQFGYAVATAGDVNDDGYADFLIGANVNDDEILSGGKAYLYLGGADYPTTTTVSYAGTLQRGYVGGAVAGGGDLNDDGFGDWVAGAPGIGVDGTHPGRAYVFLGGDPPDAVPDLVLEGEVAGGQFGAAVCLVPDLDGDGYADLVVGAPRAGDGRVYVYRGGPLPLDDTPDRVLHARADDRRFGKSLAALPDQNGDGRDELLVGVPRSSEAATWAGAVLLYHGTADLDTVPDMVFLGEVAGDEFGTSLAVSPDADGDGQQDLIVGAQFANAGLMVDAGKAYLFRAGTVLDSTADLTFTGSGTEDRLGAAVAARLDWNGDAAGDIAVGAPDYDDAGTLDAGACYVFFGGGMLDATADTMIVGPGSGVHLGTSAAGGGDIRHNGRGALLVGGYNGSDAGRVLLFGSDELPTAAPDGVPALRARLLNPWPNPFNPQVETRLLLEDSGHWRIAVFDLRGRRVALLSDGLLQAGEHPVAWNGRMTNGRSSPSGPYLIRATGPAGHLRMPVTLVR